MVSGTFGFEVETSVGVTVLGFSVELTIEVGEDTGSLSGVQEVLVMSSMMVRTKTAFGFIPISQYLNISTPSHSISRQQYCLVACRSTAVQLPLRLLPTKNQKRCPLSSLNSSPC